MIFPFYSKTLLAILFGSMLFGVWQGCALERDAGENRPLLEISDRADAEWPAETEIEYAEGFRLHYADTYKILQILNPFQHTTDTLTYVLVDRGAEPPDGFADAEVIEIPVRSVIVTSTTHIALLKMLEAEHVIRGIAGAEYVYDPEIRKGIEEEKIAAFRGGEFNKEIALAIDPDLIMISGGQASQFDSYRVLIDSGIEVVVNSEWLENTPLGKAEWVKMMAALLDREEIADEKFGQVSARYRALLEKTDTVQQKPLVINNLPYKGAWFVSGGRSFTANFFRDAGGDYPWYGTESSGGLRLNFERVYEAGLRADVWINPGTAESKEDLLAVDTRFRDFRAFQTGRIYNNNRRVSPGGGNDFWESGTVHPERVLADLIRIFHPELLPDHTLYYYQKVE
ncbi:MAG: ABC transporter substrate-binding protein [Balneolaceae bacterium]|nr:ABC transporter substrate-binding protein [Balneolaceae bacterium]